MVFNDKNYELKFTGMTLLTYKEEFHKDLLSANMAEDDFDTLSWFEIMWSLLKTADPNFMSYREFLGKITNIREVLSHDNIIEIMETISSDNKVTIDSKKK